MQLPFPAFTPKTDWKPTPVNLLPSWKDAKRVSIDIETCDPYLKTLGPGVRRGAYIAGVAFAIEDGPKYYLPIAHPEDNLPAEKVLTYLYDQSKIYEGIIVGANLPYDLDFLAEEGIEYRKASKFRDVLITDAVIYELHDSYSLEAVGGRWGVESKEEKILREAAQSYGLKNVKKELWKLPARFVAEYAANDAESPLRILRRQEERIFDEDLISPYELESDLIPVCLSMTRSGVLIDQERLSYIESLTIREEKKCSDEIKRLTGFEIGMNCMKESAIAPIIEYTGLKLPRTATGKISLKKGILEKLHHPVTDLLKKARKMHHLRTGFCQQIRNHMVRGRVHCSFNQTRRDKEDGSENVKGTITYRMSADHPSMQNQPTKDEELVPFRNEVEEILIELGVLWRSIYKKEEDDEVYWINDYSQQEPRVAVHYAEKLKLPKAKEMADRFRQDLNMDCYDLMMEMTGLERKPAKNMYLGKVYGMGGRKLCRQLGLPTQYITNRWGKRLEVPGPEGQKIIDTFDNRLPFFRLLSEEASRVAKERGYVINLGKYRLHFPKDEAGNYDFIHKALNKIIQSSSAFQTKMAMLALFRAGIPFKLQVHDELNGSGSIRQAKEAREIMKNVVQLLVPSKVDLEVGKNWGQIMKIEDYERMAA